MNIWIASSEICKHVYCLFLIFLTHRFYFYYIATRKTWKYEMIHCISHKYIISNCKFCQLFFVLSKNFIFPFSDFPYLFHIERWFALFERLSSLPVIAVIRSDKNGEMKFNIMVERWRGVQGETDWVYIR